MDVRTTVGKTKMMTMMESQIMAMANMVETTAPRGTSDGIQIKQEQEADGPQTGTRQIPLTGIAMAAVMRERTSTTIMTG
jgi:hypothetical protein